MTDVEARSLLKLTREMGSLVQVRNAARIQAGQGPLEDRKAWKQVYKECVRQIQEKERQIAEKMPSGAFQRELDLRAP